MRETFSRYQAGIYAKTAFLPVSLQQFPFLYSLRFLAWTACVRYLVTVANVENLSALKRVSPCYPWISVCLYTNGPAASITHFQTATSTAESTFTNQQKVYELFILLFSTIARINYLNNACTLAFCSYIIRQKNVSQREISFQNTNSQSARSSVLASKSTCSHRHAYNPTKCHIELW